MRRIKFSRACSLWLYKISFLRDRRVGCKRSTRSLTPNRTNEREFPNQLPAHLQGIFSHLPTFRSQSPPCPRRSSDGTAAARHHHRRLLLHHSRARHSAPARASIGFHAIRSRFRCAISKPGFSWLYLFLFSCLCSRLSASQMYTCHRGATE